MEKQVTLVRTYNAPLERVWQAWTNAGELKKWWGPDNVTIPECEIDLRVGGTFSITMEAGEAMGPYKGTLWPMTATFTTVEPLVELAYDAQAWTKGMKEETTIDQTTKITFSEDNGVTKVEVVATILKTGPKAGMAVQGMEMGFTQQLEKLNAFLSA
jgi:uncharacterized protein YndB with AHSA1/START domain